MRTIYSEAHRLHDASSILVDGQPFELDETPERAAQLLTAVQAANFGPVEPPEDHGLEPILAVHSADYVQHLRTIFADYAAYKGEPSPVFPETLPTRPIRHRPRHPDGRKGYYAFGVGTPILEGSWTAAYWSAQCALTALDRVLAGEPSAYALCRPPGHHAMRDAYGGFCFLNNAAIAAQAARKQLDKNVAILDIDFHHGNGTQEIFYKDPDVLYCSLHADPDEEYPYFWGSAEETGEGRGLGYNLNWPLPPGVDDAAYLRALDEALEVIRRDQPGLLVLSAGLDIASGDPVGGFNITLAGFAEIGRRIAALSLPTVIVQEGGYLIEKLGESITALLEAFRDQRAGV